MNEGKMILFNKHDEEQLREVFSILWHVRGLTNRPEHQAAMEWADEFQRRMIRGITISLPKEPT